MTDTTENRPASEERGEIALELDGMTLVMRPTFEAIDAFERSTGKGLLQLAREGLAQTLTLSETAQIAGECIRAWGRAVNDENAKGSNTKRIANLMLEAEGGYRVTLAIVAGMLSLAATGGYTAKGELKPAAAAKAGQTAAG